MDLITEVHSIHVPKDASFFMHDIMQIKEPLFDSDESIARNVNISDIESSTSTSATSTLSVQQMLNIINYDGSTFSKGLSR